MRFFVFIVYLYIVNGFSQEITSYRKTETIIGSVRLTDSICLKDIEKAKLDIELNNITYTIREGDMLKSEIRSTFDKLLALHKIKTQIKIVKGVDINTQFNRYCYELFINESIAQKFGKNFIKGNIRKADSLYVIENPDAIFLNGDIFDKNLFYPKAKSIKSQYDDCQSDFYKNLKLPNDFIKSNNNKFCIYSYAIFTVLKNKKITDISIETTFTNPINEKHANFIEKKLRQFIKKTKWIPEKKYGIEVNSQNVVAFFYK